MTVKPLSVAARPIERWLAARKERHAIEMERQRRNVLTEARLADLHEQIWSEWPDVAERARTVKKESRSEE